MELEDALFNFHLRPHLHPYGSRLNIIINFRGILSYPLFISFLPASKSNRPNRSSSRKTRCYYLFTTDGANVMPPLPVFNYFSIVNPSMVPTPTLKTQTVNVMITLFFVRSFIYQGTLFNVWTE